MAITLSQQKIAEYKTKQIKRGFVTCPLCSRNLEKLGMQNVVVDHDHETDLVRGLLCRSCNRQEGFMVNAITDMYKGMNKVEGLAKAIEQYPNIDHNLYTYASIGALGKEPEVVLKWMKRLGAYWHWHDTHPGNLIYKRG